MEIPKIVWETPDNAIEFLRLGAFRPEIPDWEPDVPGLTLNLGPGKKPIKNAVPLDWPAWNADTMPIPYDDETVSNIYMIHFLEHVKNPVVMLRECSRVLLPGGHLNIVVPYWRTESAHSDLDHKSWWTEDSFNRLFASQYYDKNNISDWRFKVGMNIIAGIVERNLMVLAQLIRT